MARCACGCGQITPVATRNEYRRGHIKGEHLPYVRGHWIIKNNPNPKRHAIVDNYTTCNTCGEVKPLTEFHKDRNLKLGFMSSCKSCAFEKRKAHVQLRVDMLNTIKTEAGCYFCKRAEACVLDFHHRDPEQKEDMVSRLAYNCATIQRIMKEVNKCVVLCACCHRLLHAGYLELPPD